MQSFYRLTWWTLVAVYVLILVGGIVRSTGSGMGCPDWPTCFGSVVPPTSVEQLPENYKEIYSEYRQKKNIRFAKYLSVLGFDDTADKILKDKSIREEADFNPVKTWIEYINRIVGVIIGLLIFAVLVSSVKFRKSHTVLFVVALLSFLLVVFQGWIGSFVVSTNLTPWTITVHMFLALVLVLMLIYLLFKISEANEESVSEKIPVLKNEAALMWLVVVSMITLLVQILLGTQVREAMDRVATEIADRNLWVEALGLSFVVHRSFSWIVLIVNALFLFKLWKMGAENRFVLSIILLILGTLATGIGMAWFGVPPVLQPVHLLVATITFGVEFLLVLKLRRYRQLA